MRTALLLAALLVLAACTPTPEATTAEQPVDTGPTPRETPQPREAPSIIEEPRNTTGEPVPDTSAHQPEQWRDTRAATLLVSDGEKAARMFLPQGASVENLTLATTATIHVKAISDDGEVLLVVNGERKILREDENAHFSNDTLIVHVTEVIV